MEGGSGFRQNAFGNLLTGFQVDYFNRIVEARHRVKQAARLIERQSADAAAGDRDVIGACGYRIECVVL
jgi:hypothetical protein